MTLTEQPGPTRDVHLWRCVRRSIAAQPRAAARAARRLVGLVAACAALAACAGARTLPPDVTSDDATPPAATLTGTADLPRGAGGLGLDDLRYSTRLGRVVVPAARTGAVDLIDPDTLAVTELAGLATLDNIESADEGAGFVFALDRGTQRLGMVDPSTRQLVAAAPVMGGSDYVRFVAPTSEVWVTLPGAGGIEVFAATTTGAPALVHAATIATPNGPEGLAIDATRGRAYAHLFDNDMAVIDIASRAVVARWPTGCGGVHGIPALDTARGFVFAGCRDAQVVVLDANHDGRQLGRFPLTAGTTIQAYAERLGHFYLRGDPGVPIAVLGVSAAGELSLLGTVDSAMTGHCMTADDRGHFWACDAANGRIQRFRDPYAPSTM